MNALHTVYVPPKGQTMLDDAEDAEKRSLCVCVGCAMRRFGQQMVISILCAQEDDWK